MPEILERNKLKDLRRSYFVNPDGSNLDIVIEQITMGLRAVVESMGKSPMYSANEKTPNLSSVVSNSKMPEQYMVNPSDVLEELGRYVQASVVAGHPFMVKNIIPTASIPALSAYLASSILMGNGATGEDAGRTLMAEIACTTSIAKLVDYDPQVAGGVFTFGGTGTNLYGLKIGLSKVDPEHSKQGISKSIVCIESVPSHYCHATAANWLGIGTANLIRVGSNLDQTTKLDELEQACRSAIERGKRIACINVLGGTTSNMGIDDIQEIAKIREGLVNEYNLDYIPHIHADAVLGWAFLVFKDYDFIDNPLGFKQETLDQLKAIVKRISTLRYADSFGVDFHKTGYVAYNSSMIMVKNKEDFKLLRRGIDIVTPLFHDEEAYNPGMFTLETSRSAANILGTWIAMETFGKEGYQLLLGHAIEIGHVYREAVRQHQSEGLYLANQQFCGADVFIRCYPPQVNVEETYNNELWNDNLLKINSAYTTKFAKWMEKEKIPFQEKGFAISRSSAAIYTYTGAPMIALRIYPMSPFIDSCHAIELVERLARQKAIFDHDHEVNV